MSLPLVIGLDGTFINTLIITGWKCNYLFLRSIAMQTQFYRHLILHRFCVVLSPLKKAIMIDPNAATALSMLAALFLVKILY